MARSSFSATMALGVLLGGFVGCAHAAGPPSPYAEIIRKEAGLAGLPFEIADAVVAVESAYDPGRIGSVGEIGLMQVRPGTAALLGFRGSNAELARPETNIHFGVTYLAQAWEQAGKDLCRALMKYRAGHGQEIMSPLSAEYCQRARDHMEKGGAIWPGMATLVTAAASVGHLEAKPAHAPGLPSLQGLHGTAFWAAHDLRVRILTARVEQRWKRMAFAR